MSGASFVYDLPITNTDYDTDKTSRVTLAIFFDGTCNNRENINAMSAKSKNAKQATAVEEYSTDPTSSYHNDHTNVDQLQQAVMNSIDNLKSIYIEGSGTVDLYKDDAVMGTGFGCGSDGIRAKSKKPV